MNVIRIPDGPDDHRASDDDVLVNRHAVTAGVQDSLPELATLRRRVVLTISASDECLTIASLRAKLPDIDHMITMLLGELQANGIIDKHAHPDSKDIHYHLTPDGERFARAN